MKIAIDALPLLGQAGGRSYLNSVLKHIFSIDSENHYTLSFRIGVKKNNLIDNFSFPSNVLLSKIRIPNRILEFFWTRENICMPLTKKLFGNPDIYFSTIYFSPVFKKCQIVSVVYDITTMKYDGYKEHREIFDLRLKNTIKRSKYLITISEYTKNDLCKYYDVQPDRIVVIPLAADEIFNMIEDKERIIAVLRKYKIDERYILYVGNLGPHKNLHRLVNVFEKLKRVHGIPHKLVLCGKKYWGQEIIETIHRLNLQEEILVLDYIPDEDLPYIYSGAEMFVFISLYEGFGLPVVEAMACGVPVIASNTTSIPEVVGDAGILVNPLNEEEILTAILKVLNDGQLKKELGLKGINRAKFFSWEKTARETLEVFKRALQ
ncbi:MAG: glycosyltransferase family 1 protein [Elusimicrobiota bacterium]